MITFSSLRVRFAVIEFCTRDMNGGEFDASEIGQTGESYDQLQLTPHLNQLFEASRIEKIRQLISDAARKA